MAKNPKVEGKLWLQSGGKHKNLAGGLEHDLFFHILGISSSQVIFIFFRGVGQPPTSEFMTISSCQR
jgi:hypothetical protein